MDRVLEKLGKYSCLEWAIALIPVLFGGLIYLLYRFKSIILFEALNKLGGELTKLVQLRGRRMGIMMISSSLRLWKKVS